MRCRAIATRVNTPNRKKPFESETLKLTSKCVESVSKCKRHDDSMSTKWPKWSEREKRFRWMLEIEPISMLKIHRIGQWAENQNEWDSLLSRGVIDVSRLCAEVAEIDDLELWKLNKVEMDVCRCRFTLNIFHRQKMHSSIFVLVWRRGIGSDWNGWHWRDAMTDYDNEEKRINRTLSAACIWIENGNPFDDEIKNSFVNRQKTRREQKTQQKIKRRWRKA